MDKQLEKDINFNISESKYKCTSDYKIPHNPKDWLNCPNCGLKPLVWVFDNGKSTACGCGKNEYDHFSIRSESIGSHAKRNSGSTLHYDLDKLRKNWNHWVNQKEELESQEWLKKRSRW